MAVRADRIVPGVVPKRTSDAKKSGKRRAMKVGTAGTRKGTATHKPTRIPDGFVLVIDTREQRPLFDGRNDIPVEHRVLHDGDYSVSGYETLIIVERKKLSDFLSYVGKERVTKTIPKLCRLSAARFAALIIEEDERKLDGPFTHSKLTGEHVRAFLLSCRVRYGIHVYISKDRAALERFVLDHCVKAWSIIQEEGAHNVEQ